MFVVLIFFIFSLFLRLFHQTRNKIGIVKINITNRRKGHRYRYLGSLFRVDEPFFGHKLYVVICAFYLNKFTIATANRARRRMTIAPRAMTIHFTTFTTVVREESARSM